MEFKKKNGKKKKSSCVKKFRICVELYSSCVQLQVGHTHVMLRHVSDKEGAFLLHTAHSASPGDAGAFSWLWRGEAGSLLHLSGGPASMQVCQISFVPWLMSGHRCRPSLRKTLST